VSWLLSVFKRFDPWALVSLVAHLILRVLGVRAPSLWNRTKAATQRYPDDTLLGLRATADPDADKVVSTIVDAAAGGQADQPQVRITAARQLLTTIGANIVLDPADHPPAARAAIAEWMASVGPMPPDLDDVRLRRASEFFARNSFVIALVFGTSSLLEAYACPRGVCSLAATDDLVRDTHRRLAETMQWVLLVEDRANWSSGKVMAAILKIRLMHATIRQLIHLFTQLSGNPWQLAELGEPVCGMDLLGMLMGFGATPIRDLPKLGVNVSREDAEAHLYLWSIIGRYIGVNEYLIPKTLAEAKGLVERVKALEQHEGPDGEAFAKALIGFHLAISPGLDSYATHLIQDLVGSRVCSLLKIDPKHFADATIAVPRPLPLIRDLTLGMLRAVLPGRIKEMISLPPDGQSAEPFNVDLPGTAVVKKAHEALKRRKTAELWGEALLVPGVVSTPVYSRPKKYEIPAEIAERWDKKDPRWREGRERLASRLA
jgi:mpaB/rubber oxygenase-like protein